MYLCFFSLMLLFNYPINFVVMILDSIPFNENAKVRSFLTGIQRREEALFELYICTVVVKYHFFFEHLLSVYCNMSNSFKNAEHLSLTSILVSSLWNFLTFLSGFWVHIIDDLLSRVWRACQKKRRGMVIITCSTFAFIRKNLTNFRSNLKKSCNNFYI
jgi:hypothetical protein